MLSTVTTSLVVLAACSDEAATPASGGESSSATKAEVSCKGKPEVGKLASSFSMSSVNGGQKMGVE